jgi:hypothetical protein
MCRRKGDVRYYSQKRTAIAELPNGDCLLYPKADMCGALAYVCFGPKADIGTAGKSNYSITSSAREIIVGGTNKPIAFGRFQVDDELKLCRQLHWNSEAWSFVIFLGVTNYSPFPKPNL